MRLHAAAGERGPGGLGGGLDLREEVAAAGWWEEVWGVGYEGVGWDGGHESFLVGLW